MKTSLIIATRQSPLALWQANWVKMQLERLYPHLTIQLLGITTIADARLETTLAKIGGKGLFVKELESALLDNRADIAVHSMKDVPMDLPHGLQLPVICQREDPRDVYVSNRFASLDDMPNKLKLGTSSIRRQSQLRALKPGILIENLRGNVNSRLQRLDNNEFGGLILANAGLIRLGLQHRIRSYLSLEESLPAAGQGAIGIECREEDVDIKQLIAPLNHPATFICVTAERALCQKLGGGCQLPIGAYAEIDKQRILLKGLVAKPDGSLLIKSQQTGLLEEPELLGKTIAEHLLQQGADDILINIKG